MKEEDTEVKEVTPELVAAFVKKQRLLRVQLPADKGTKTKKSPDFAD